MSSSNYISGQDIYSLLEKMFINMDKLFSSLEIEEEKSELMTSNLVLQFFENILYNGAVGKNIELLNRKLTKAIEKSEDNRLAIWSSNNDIAQADCEIKRLKDRIGQLQQELEQTIKLKEEAEAMCSELQNEKKAVEEKLGSELKAAGSSNHNLIMSMITLRDSILMRVGLAEEQEDINLKALLGSLLKETAKVLENTGVTILDECSKYDSSRQIVTDVRDTDSEELHDTVAQVFRPGYLYEDKLIRPEEVILYSYKRS